MSDHVVLTTVPVQALAQPLVDFLGANGVSAFTFEDDTGLDATRGVEIRVTASDESKAKDLLADYWASNEASGDEM
ncbi:MAG: hypothetical protein JNJ59_18095 [Deltaproteobacteria bacterium]|jgi:hypothetical protein|nr:hypothetical protein [Deltaproteobacteria bacterium]